MHNPTDEYFCLSQISGGCLTMKNNLFGWSIHLSVYKGPEPPGRQSALVHCRGVHCSSWCCVSRCWHCVAFVGSFLPVDHVELAVALQWEKSLWPAVQVRGPLLKKKKKKRKRKWKNKEKAPWACYCAIYDFTYSKVSPHFFSSASLPVTFVTILARVVSKNGLLLYQSVVYPRRGVPFHAGTALSGRPL